MIERTYGLLLAICTVLLCACASTSVKQTWKSPDQAEGPVGTVAVLAIDERGIVRTALENRMAYELKRIGQPFVLTHELLPLPQIKEDKEAAVERFREAGAETILITRVITSAAQARSFRAGGERYAPVVTGYSPGSPYYGIYDWYGYYEIAYQDMSTVWSTQSKQLLLETSLFDLADGKRLWACLTQTTLKETTDRLAEADRLAEKTVSALRKDGFVK